MGDAYAAFLLSGDCESVVTGLKRWDANEVRSDLEDECPLFCRAAQAGLNDVCIAYLAQLALHGLASSCSNPSISAAMSTPAGRRGIATLATLKESRLLQQLRTWQREFLSALCRNPSRDEGVMRRAAVLAVRLPADTLMKRTEGGVPLGHEIFLHFRTRVDVAQLPDELFGLCVPAPLLWHVLEHGPLDLVPGIWEEMEKRGTTEDVALGFAPVGDFHATTRGCTDENRDSWEWIAPRLVELVDEEVLTEQGLCGMTLPISAAFQGNVPLLRALSEKFGKAVFHSEFDPYKTALISAISGPRPAMEAIRFLMEECPELADSVDYYPASKHPHALLEILPHASPESWQAFVWKGNQMTLAHLLADDVSPLTREIHTAAGRIEALRWLCARCEPSWLGRQEYRGRTALHCAFVCCNFDKASLLAEAMDQEDLLLCDRYGSTVAHSLVRKCAFQPDLLEKGGHAFEEFIALLPREVLGIRNEDGLTVSETAASVGFHEWAAQLQPMVKKAL